MSPENTEKLAQSADKLHADALVLQKLVRDSKGSKMRSALAVVLSLIAVVATGYIGANNVKRSAFVHACHVVNDSAVQPLHNLLETSQTSSQRNPLPPNLTDEQRAYYEGQRAQAAALFKEGLDATQPVDCEALAR